MKKVLLADEALKTMFSEEEEVKIEQTADAKVEETVADEESAADKNKDCTKEDCEDSMKEVMTDLLAAEALVVTMTADKEALAAEVEKVKGELAASQAGYDKMKSIVFEQINRMRLAMKIVDVDMSAMDADTIVRQYEATKESFVKSFKVGPQVPAEQAEKKGEVWQASSIDAANVNALGFK